MDNFQYFLGDKRTKEIAVIDPAWDVDLLCSIAKDEGYTITNIFLTHGHNDHLNGLDEILSRHDVPAYISKHEHPQFMPSHKNVVQIEDGHVLKVGDIEFKAVLTPGHSPGCQCFIHENVMITGDCIFIDGCGRCDLPGSDPREMYNTLYNVILPMPDELICYPGHNYGPTPFATLGDQKKSNPYLTCSSLDEFLVSRMGMTL